MSQEEVNEILETCDEAEDGAPDTLMGDDCSEFDHEPEYDQDEPTDDRDADADSQWLASAGLGSDEDYGGNASGFYDE